MKEQLDPHPWRTAGELAMIGLGIPFALFMFIEWGLPTYWERVVCAVFFIILIACYLSNERAIRNNLAYEENIQKRMNK